MTNGKKHSYGWRPDKPDRRDLHYAPPARLALALPPSVDLRSKMPPVYDQGALGSCTANMGSGMMHYLMLNGMHVQDNIGEVFTPSRLGGYYDERVIEGTTDYDSGAEIRDMLKVIAQNGLGPEDKPGDPSNWPYNVSQFTKKPPAAYYTHAAQHQGLVYARVSQNECVMKGVLAQGLPIGIGFTVYDSFESDYTNSTGIVTMPGGDEGVLGGHAVVIVGYDDKGDVAPIQGCWIVRNSWGNWGDAGYCYFPYAYLLDNNLSDDFWVLKSIE